MGCLLECKHLTKHFGGLVALKDVNMQVMRGEITGIIGPNGAGKTTLFNIIAGALPPTCGNVSFKGQELSEKTVAEVCRLGIARTYQIVRPFNSLTTLENVLIGLSFGRIRPPPFKKRVIEAMDILNLMGLEGRANNAADTLTLVEKRYLEIARAMATSPEILLLDEVLSGLGPAETVHAMKTIRQIQCLGVTVIMIEHVLKVIMELCGRVIVLHYGVKIADGAPEEVTKNPTVVKAYIGNCEMNDRRRAECSK
jgi:branched-chain amino acid transport system ATP-binding protein